MNASSTFTKGGVLTFTGAGNLNDANSPKQDLGVLVNSSGNRTQMSDILASSVTTNLSTTWTTSAFDLEVAGAITNNGEINASSQNAGNTITIGGDFTNGIFTSGNGSVVLMAFHNCGKPITKVMGTCILLIMRA